MRKQHPQLRFPVQQSQMKRLLTTALLLAAAIPAQALTYNFSRVTNNGNENVSDQIQLDVFQISSCRIGFTLSNQGSIDSIITAVYFDDELDLFRDADLWTTSSGVSFKEEGEGSGNLPGSSNSDFDSDFWFNRASRHGASNGINNTLDASEYAVFSLKLRDSDLSLSSVYSALDDGDLRLGLHIQSIGSNGGSDSYVTEERRVNVPESGSNIALAAIAFAVIIATKRRLLPARS